MRCKAIFEVRAGVQGPLREGNRMKACDVTGCPNSPAVLIAGSLSPQHMYDIIGVELNLHPKYSTHHLCRGHSELLRAKLDRSGEWPPSTAFWVYRPEIAAEPLWVCVKRVGGA